MFICFVDLEKTINGVLPTDVVIYTNIHIHNAIYTANQTNTIEET